MTTIRLVRLVFAAFSFFLVAQTSYGFEQMQELRPTEAEKEAQMACANLASDAVPVTAGFRRKLCESGVKIAVRCLMTAEQLWTSLG
jgi:hypothetical protein